MEHPIHIEPKDVVKMAMELSTITVGKDITEKCNFIAGLDFQTWWRSTWSVGGKVGPFIMFPCTQIAMNQITAMLNAKYGIINTVGSSMFFGNITMDPSHGIKTDDLIQDFKRKLTKKWEYLNEGITDIVTDSDDVAQRQRIKLPVLFVVQAYDLHDISIYAGESVERNAIIDHNGRKIKSVLKTDWEKALRVMYTQLVTFSWRVGIKYIDKAADSMFGIIPPI